mmetsp:Transcript_27478/g.78622  ORF Transcript_27478/g.78622 Transcript_27478/m.78622 type:complete len:219 (-) Transcript_27478:2310-2966(-)
MNVEDAVTTGHPSMPGGAPGDNVQARVRCDVEIGLVLATRLRHKDLQFVSRTRVQRSYQHSSATRGRVETFSDGLFEELNAWRHLLLRLSAIAGAEPEEGQCRLRAIFGIALHPEAGQGSGLLRRGEAKSHGASSGDLPRRDCQRRVQRQREGMRLRPQDDALRRVPRQAIGADETRPERRNNRDVRAGSQVGHLQEATALSIRTTRPRHAKRLGTCS